MRVPRIDGTVVSIGDARFNLSTERQKLTERKKPVDRGECRRLGNLLIGNRFWRSTIIEAVRQPSATLLFIDNKTTRRSQLKADGEGLRSFRRSI